MNLEPMERQVRGESTAPVKSAAAPLPAAAPPSDPRRPVRARRRRRALIGVELATGAAAVVGGLLLAVARDGSLMHADPAVLVGTPFSDWRLPGTLLSTLVGVGYIGTAVWEWRNKPHARELSMFAGLGLVVFEAAELAWIGFQPLEVVFAEVGAGVFALATPER